MNELTFEKRHYFKVTNYRKWFSLAATCLCNYVENLLCCKGQLDNNTS